MKLLRFTLFLLGLLSLTSCQSNFSFTKQNYNQEQEEKTITASTENNEFNVVMIPLDAVGDSTLIDYGDLEILIDAGGSSDSKTNIVNTLNEYVSDNKLEMIIITHSDNDHLISFSGDDGIEGWLNQKNYSCDYLIDFDILKDISVNFDYKNNFFQQEKDNTTDDNDEDEEELNTPLKTPYVNYIESRNKLILSGKIKHYLTASECVYQERGINIKNLRLDAKSIARSTFLFDSSGNITDTTNDSVKVKILYNYFYDHKANIKYDQTHIPTSYELNLISVCNYIEFDNNKYLFTGDLCEFNSGLSYTRVNGEKNLIEYNQELKDGVYFFKAGHHGSLTSNSLEFLNYIRPCYIGINCVLNGQFDFPNDNVLNNMCKWTDYIYITQKKSDDIIQDLHGKIIFTYDSIKKEMSVNYTNLGIGNSIFDIQEIFNSKFTSYSIYNLSSGDKYAEGECTYIKLGHIDMVINSGAYAKNSQTLPTSPVFLEKIKHYCNDKVLDYVILSGSSQTNIFDFVGQSDKKDGLLYNNDNYFKELTNFILLEQIYDVDFILYNNLKEIIDTSQRDGFIKNIIDPSKVNSTKLNIAKYNNLSCDLYFLNYKYPSTCNSIDLLSIPFILSINDFDYLNLGRLTDEYDDFNNLFMINQSLFSAHKIDLFTLPKFGRSALNDGKDTINFMNKVMLKNYGTSYLFCPGNFGTYNLDNTLIYPNYGMISNQSYKNLVYSSLIVNNNTVSETEGDLRANIQIKNNQMRFRIRSEIRDQKYYDKVSEYTDESNYARNALSYLL